MLSGTTLAGIYLTACNPAPAPPRNLLLITLDTLRADRLGAYGYRQGVTPTLDALGREGWVFEEAMTAAPLTLPSHASLLSGLLPPRHGLRSNGQGRFPEDAPTLATVLAAQGLATGAFVGTFVLDHRFGLDRGFDAYDDAVRGSGGGSPDLHSERRAGEVADRAVAWLDSVGNRPFFAWVHLFDAHAPYEPPAPYDKLLGDPYDGEIAYLDTQVKRLLEQLEATGQRSRTLVVVAGDHGESLGEHGEMTHGLLLYEPTLHVPLLLAGPTLPAGRRVATPVSLADLAPTLAGLLGFSFPASTPRPLDGRDLSAALASSGEPPPSELYAETEYPAIFGWSPMSALRRGRFKYIAAPRPELFDLSADPREESNLLASRSQDAEQIEQRLVALRQQTFQAQPAPQDAESRARLASLGYVGAGAGRRADGDGSPQALISDGADPKDRVGLFHRFEEATQLLADGSVEGATAELSTLVEQDPTNPVFLGELAHARRRAGDPDGAVALYRRALELAPDDVQTWSNLATALHEAGRGKEAREALREVLRLDSEQPEAHNLLGLTFLAEGRLDDARTELERAATLDPGNARVQCNLGHLWRSLGQPQQAEAAYLRALELEPELADAFNGLAVLYVGLDRPREALPLLARTLELAPSRHEARLNRGIAYELLGDTPAATEAYRDFLRRVADDPAYAQQRQAAHRLLARLTPSAASAPSPSPVAAGKDPQQP